MAQIIRQTLNVCVISVSDAVQSSNAVMFVRDIDLHENKESISANKLSVSCIFFYILRIRLRNLLYEIQNL